MKVIKTLDLDGAEVNITEWYAAALTSNCDKGSTKYKHSMESFNNMLLEITNKAFKLGQDNK
tara:strand:+ start:942 stop:1127 length:186 start_codon:yes stop_codon:yes gene_type:complete